MWERYSIWIRICCLFVLFCLFVCVVCVVCVFLYLFLFVFVFVCDCELGFGFVKLCFGSRRLPKSWIRIFRTKRRRLPTTISDFGSSNFGWSNKWIFTSFIVRFHLVLSSRKNQSGRSSRRTSYQTSKSTKYNFYNFLSGSTSHWSRSFECINFSQDSCTWRREKFVIIYLEYIIQKSNVQQMKYWNDEWMWRTLWVGVEM